MRVYFLDSSSFLKLFVVEPGSERVRSIVRSALMDAERVKVSVCDLAHPEAVSALRQMLDRGLGGRRGISSATFRRTVPELAQLVRSGSLFAVVLTSGVVEDAASLAARHRIRGADSVHVAAALQVRSRAQPEDEFWFVSADRRQSGAARDEGLTVLDPTT